MTGVRSLLPTGDRVAVVRLDNLGDVLLAGPAVRAVAARAEEVTFICGPAGRAAAELLPGVDRIITFDAPWIPLDAKPVERPAIDQFVHEVADAHLDAAIVLTSFHQSPLPMALLLKMAGVAWVAAASEDHPGSLVDVRVRPGDDDGHEVERSLDLAARTGYPLPPEDPGHLAIRRPLVAPDLPSEFRAGGYTVVHPGASVPARAIPVERAQALVELLADRGEPVVVTGGPGESELVARVAGHRRGVALFPGNASLAELAGLLDQAGVVVSGNTGPAHLAAAVGTPVVSVFAPVVPPERWAPWKTPVTVLGDHSIGCRGCRGTGLPVALPAVSRPGHRHCAARRGAWLARLVAAESALTSSAASR